MEVLLEQYNKLCLSCKKECKQYAFAMVIECRHYLHNGVYYQNSPDKVKELTSADKKKLKHLIYECANYNKDNNECLPLDTSCYMLLKGTVNSGICSYFEKAVLPLNKELEVILKDLPSNLKTCAICRKKFPVNGRQKYCSEPCKVLGTKEAEKQKKRRQRQKEG